MSVRSSDKFPTNSDVSNVDISVGDHVDENHKHPSVTRISNWATEVQDIRGDTQENAKIDDKSEQEFPYTSRKMSEESKELLIPGGRRGWKNFSSLERALSIALGLVSAVAVGLMIAVIVVGVKLNKDDYTAVSKVTTTLLPPWVTTVSTTNRPDVTTRERPTSTASTPPANSYGTCMTNECYRVAGPILLSLDQSMDPCEDFYKFACGGWMTNNPTTDEGLVITQLSKSREKFFVDIKSMLESNVPGNTEDDVLATSKEVYTTCMFPSGDIDSHAADLNSFIEEKLINFSENATTLFSLYQLLGNLRKDLGADYVISVKVDSDIFDRTKNSIYLDKPEFGINPLFFETQELSSYKDLIAQMWMTVYPQSELNDAQKIADEIIDFENQLVQMSLNRSQSNSLEMYTLDFWELNSFADGNETNIEPWKVFVSEVFGESMSACNGTEDCETSTLIILNDPEFLQDIESLLNNSDYTTIGNYLRWRLIQDFARDSDEKFYNPFKQFDEKILEYPNPTVLSTRWKYCTTRILYFFPSVITEVFVKQFIKDPVSFREEVNAMADSVLLSFYNMVESLPWIATNNTRNLITDDLDELKIVLAGIVSEFDDTNSTNYYSGLNLTDSSSSLQNIFDLTKWKSSKELLTAFGTQEVNRMAQNLDSQRTMNVLFSPLSDTIFLPVGILQPPTFSEIKTNVISLNYGSLGAMIGMKLMDVLHSSAQKYINGSFMMAWDEESTVNYQNATNCLAPVSLDYYETVTEDEQSPSQVVASHLGGLTSAFNAYKRDNRVVLPNQQLPGLSYTPEQIFFLGYAQTMCRTYPQGKTSTQDNGFFGISSAVQTTLENSKDFQTAWSCPKSKNTCNLW